MRGHDGLFQFFCCLGFLAQRVYLDVVSMLSIADFEAVDWVHCFRKRELHSGNPNFKRINKML